MKQKVGVEIMSNSEDILDLEFEESNDLIIDPSNSAEDIDLDLEQMSFEEVEGFDSSEFIKAFGLENVDTSNVPDFDLDLWGTEDSEESLDLESEVTEILRYKSDLSRDLLEYYNYANHVVDKVYHNMKSTGAKFVRPSLDKFSYISNSEERIKVYAYFYEMMKDLITEPQYSNLSIEEAYDVMLNKLKTDVMWSPSLYRSEFHAMFVSYYRKNKDMYGIQSVAYDSTIDTLLSLDDLSLSLRAFEVNSLVFNTISNYFSTEDNLLSSSESISVSEFGLVVTTIVKEIYPNMYTKLDLFKGFISFMHSEYILKDLNLTQDAALDYSIGELVRRYVLKELTEGTFVPEDMKKFQGSLNFNDAVKLLLLSLKSCMNTNSFAAEILYVILYLMYDETANTKYLTTVLAKYVYGISDYLCESQKNSYMVNPVVYSRLSKENEEGPNKFQITYTVADNVENKSVDGILCDVVGDNSEVFRVPLVVADKEYGCVICPPREVVDRLRSTTSVVRIAITGNAKYKYTPTYDSLADLNLTYTDSMEIKSESKPVRKAISNPLLSALMGYSNEFVSDGLSSEVYSIESDLIESCIVLKLSDGTNRIARLKIKDRDGIYTGFFVVDDQDGSGIMKFRDENGEDDILVLDPGTYNIPKVTNCEQSNGDGFSYKVLELLPTVQANSYLPVIVKRLCKINAIDYESELEQARELIIKDLARIVDPVLIDMVAGYELLGLYREYIESVSDIDFNCRCSLKDVFDFTVGEVDFNFTNSSKEDLLNLIDSNLDGIIEDIKLEIDEIRNLDTDILALQILSNSHIHSDSDAAVFYAVNHLTPVREVLCLLENKMVLLHVLSEIGVDVHSTFMKISQVYDAYFTSCDAQFISTLETYVVSSVKAKDKVCFNLMQKLFENDVSDTFIVLKYFILSADIPNIYSTLKELKDSGDINSEEYNDLCEFLEDSGLCTDLETFTLSKDHKQGDIFIFINYLKEELMPYVYRGLLAEASKNNTVDVIKAYDLMNYVGDKLFNLGEDSFENICDVDKFRDKFNEYMGCMYLTYTPVVGEGCSQIQGGLDRYSAFMVHRPDFVYANLISEYEKYDLTDLSIMEGTGIDNTQDEE